MVALTSEELLKEQLEAIASQPRRRSSPRGVEPPKRVAIKYNSDLQKLVLAITKDIRTDVVQMVRALEPEYVTDAWPDSIASVFSLLLAKWTSPTFNVAASDVARVFVSAVNTTNLKKTQVNAKRIGIDVFGASPNIDNILAAAAQDNVRLIKSIPTQYLNQVETIVTGNMRAGLRPSAIVSQISEQFGVTRNRAALIARDQTSKINGELSKQRQLDTGFELFKWEDADDSRVRTRHNQISKADVGFGPGVYRWDNPPKNEKGQSIIPGQEINCRCFPRAVLSPEE